MRSDPSSENGLSRHLFAGTVFAATILVFIFFGVKIDQHWQSGPWGVLVGAITGFSVAFWNLIREFSSNRRE